jgi:uncharacterized protein (DUF1778 family)
MAREQLNLRLPPDWFDVLNAEAQIGNESVPEFVRTVIEEKVAELAGDEDVLAVKEAIERARERRRGQASQAESNVTPLRNRAASDGAK